MTILVWILAFVIAITVHEAAHAYMADRLGDPTPRMMGRLSLNPAVHYDPVGTTLLLVLVFMRAMGIPVIPFGWAKPVQFDPYNLENPRRDAALISFAGPFSNLALSVILAVFYKIFSLVVYPSGLLISILAPIIMLNVVLAIFNLIPVHPLDGEKIVAGLLSSENAHGYQSFMRRYGILVLFLLIFPTVGGTSPLFLVIGPLINLVLNILLPAGLVV